MWKLWWSKVGDPASVVKVNAHRALQEATSLEELWVLKGNRLADKWARAGAQLWSIEEEQGFLLKAASAV
eukprot:6319569-Pyramimonas_sp.AAC.1